MRYALLVLALLVGCVTTAKRGISDDELLGWPKATAEGVTVRYKEGDLDQASAEYVARRISLVRSTVASELALVGSAAPPYAEVLLYRDTGWGQERWLVTHAIVLERPLRVRIPCTLPEEDTDGEKMAARIRGTCAHEIAEASVLTRVPILDPYLRWLHDGIAESSAYRVLLRLDPKAAEEMLVRYEEYAREARRGKRPVSWLDLTRWRQLPDWIVHSDILFKGGPLRLDNVAESLRRINEKRVSAESDPETVAVLDALLDILGESWIREQLPYADGEADLRPESGQFLCYDASCCFFLELERAHPGITASAIAAIEQRHEAVLRSDDVAAILRALSGEDVRVRLERFTLDRLEGILAAERQRSR